MSPTGCDHFRQKSDTSQDDDDKIFLIHDDDWLCSLKHGMPQCSVTNYVPHTKSGKQSRQTSVCKLHQVVYSKDKLGPNLKPNFFLRGQLCLKLEIFSKI